MSSDEGSNGNKRKTKESAGGSPKKRVHFADNDEKQTQTNIYAPSTSSGITEDDQAPINEEEIKWITYCHLIPGVIPKCKLCKQHHPFYIEPTIFNDHVKNEHKLDKPDETDSMDWIYRHFVPSQELLELHKLECETCNKRFEVRKFYGPFIEHFKEKHKDKSACRSDYKNLFKEVINFFYEECESKHPILDAKNVRERKVWWMRYVREFEENKAYCIFPKCPHKYTVNFTSKEDFEIHIRQHLLDQNLRRNPDNSEYLSFENYVLRCKLCNQSLTYHLTLNFAAHLNLKHGIKRESQVAVGELSQETDIDTHINNHLTTLMKYLIEKKIFN